MYILGHFYSGINKSVLKTTGDYLFEFAKHRCENLCVSDRITKYVLNELMQRIDLDESKAIYTAKRGGIGSDRRKKYVARIHRQVGSTAKILQHKREASSKLNPEIASFESHLLKLIKQYQGQKISFDKLVTRSSIAFKGTIETVFSYGMMAAGFTLPSGEIREPTHNDKKWLLSYVKEEMGYFKRFLKSVKSESSPKFIGMRVHNYSEALRSVYEAGRVLASGTYASIQWIIESKNPCPDCIVLSEHSPFVPDTLPTTPKAGQTRCRSKCYCSLKIDKITRRRYRTIKSKNLKPNYLMRKIRESQKKKGGKLK